MIHEMPTDQNLQARLDALRERLRGLESVAVAFSAGVDSTFLLKVAHDELGDRAVAVSVRAPFTPQADWNAAISFCRAEGIRLATIDASLESIPHFQENPPDRCYHCKKALFTMIAEFARENRLAAIVEGSNLDDDGDYRPGRRAIRELGVVSPLHDAALSKADIRALSRQIGLPTWNRPSAACLASRIPYGTRITAAGLARVDAAERWMRAAFPTLSQIRVRSMPDGIARIEVPPDDIPKVSAEYEALDSRLRELGFAGVEIDPRGYRTGSLNEALAATTKMTHPSEIADRIVAGGAPATAEELLDLLRNAPRAELHEAAHRVTEALAPKRFDFCGIVNARSGRCPEDCKWCAQSAHWKTGVDCHGWIGAEACVKAAREAEANGVGRIGIVTSGRAQSPADIDALCDALRAMRRESRIHLCGSLGLLSPSDIAKLKEAGLERVHCNIETAPSHFGSLCTTHTQEEKTATLRAAREAGLEICCGGIIGMGESDEQLVEFALALAEIAPASIPVNILHPIPGTPLGDRQFLDEGRILDSIAILRLANPRTPLRFAGGRARLSDDVARRAIRCGISAGIAGPLLTTPGADYADDRALAAEAGYDVAQPLRDGPPR